MSLSSDFWSKRLEKKLESLNAPPAERRPQAPAGLEVTEEDAPPVYLESIPEMPPDYREIFLELEGALVTEGALAAGGTPAAEGTQAAEGTPDPEETPVTEETSATEGAPSAGGPPAAGGPPESFLRFLVRLGKKILSSVWGSIRDFLSFIGILAKKVEEQPDSAPFDLEKEIFDMSEKQKARDAASIDEAGKALKENLQNRSPQEQRRGLTAWGKMLGWVGDAWDAFKGWLPDLSVGALKRRGEQLSSGIRGMMIKVGDVFLKAWRWLSGGAGPSL